MTKIDKKNMMIFSIRLQSETIRELREISQNRHLPLRTMIRAWILERLDIEMEIDKNG